MGLCTKLAVRNIRILSGQNKAHMHEKFYCVKFWHQIDLRVRASQRECDGIIKPELPPQECIVMSYIILLYMAVKLTKGKSNQFNM